MQPQRVREDGLDDVAVADRDPRRVGAEPLVDPAYGGDGAALRVAQRLTARERRRARMCLHDLPERILGQLLQLLAGPVAVATLAQVVVGLDGEVATGGECGGGLDAAVEWTADNGRHRYP